MAEWLDDGRVIVGLFSAGAILVVALVGGVIKLCLWIGSTGTDVNNLEKSAGEDRSTFKDIAGEIKKDIDIISADIKGILGRLSPLDPLVQKASPLQLTETGKKTSQALKAREWAEELAPGLHDQLKDKEDFEVDAFCQKYVLRKLAPATETRVLRRAYETGTEEADIRKVLAVVLRDELLSYR